MVNTNVIKTRAGKRIVLYRSNTQNGSLSSTQYLPESKAKVGINAVTPNIDNTDLSLIIPVLDGTVCDNGANTLTGSSGGDNTTDNTVTFKQGGGVTDVTGQNLIANTSSVTKKWAISDLASAGVNADSTKYVGLWLYIKDSATLAKFLTAGTCLEIRIGADTTTNYYSKVYTASELSVLWNWLSDNDLLSSWDVNGTPGVLNDFAIIITTNNATDSFVAGDVVYDLLRQWESSDTLFSIEGGVATLDFNSLTSTKSFFLSTTMANGFLIDNIAAFNEDTSPLMGLEASFAEDSKSNTDQWRLQFVERIIL